MNAVVDGPVVGALDPKPVVLSFYALLNERKFDGAFKLLCDDLQWWLSGTQSVGGLRTSGTLKKAEFTQAMGLVSDLTVGGMTFEPGMILVDGNRLGMTVESKAKLKNGRTYQNHIALFFEVGDGQIAWVKEYPDTKHVHDTLLAP